MALTHSSDIYMCETSFVAFKNGILIALIHIPIYKTVNSMTLLQYHPTPLHLNNESKTQILVEPQRSFIAIKDDETLYSSYTENEIHHQCKIIHNNHYCDNRNILQRTTDMDCLLSLFKKNKENIKQKCSLKFTEDKEVIYQLNTTCI